MLVTIHFDEVECDRFTMLEGRLVLSDDQNRTLYVANVDRWISFEVSYDE